MHGGRFPIILYIKHEPQVMIQSLILLAAFAFASFILFALGIIGGLLKANRKMLEEILYQNRCRGDSREWERGVGVGWLGGEGRSCVQLAVRCCGVASPACAKRFLPPPSLLRVLTITIFMTGKWRYDRSR